MVLVDEKASSILYDLYYSGSRNRSPSILSTMMGDEWDKSKLEVKLC